MTRIFIEGTEVDITSELSQQVTFAIDDIRKIEAKATTYSKTIVLPGTANNNRIFGNVYELTRSNDISSGGLNSFYDFDASRSASARLEINGLLIMKGVARLLSIRREGEALEYEIALFGELGGFISEIGTRKIEELDFSAYDHAWTEANIRATWPDTAATAAVNSFSGPFSSANYNPPIDFITIELPGQVSFIRAGEEFEITGSATNDGIYIAYDVIYKSISNTTDIIVQIYLGQPFTPEGSGATLTKAQSWGTGYVYPLIDYGVAQPGTFPLDHDFRHFRPALFVREYMVKIMEEAGFTWESNFFDTPLFRRLVVPNNDAVLEKRGTTQYVNAENDSIGFSQAFPVYPGGGYNTSNNTPGGITVASPIDWTNIITAVSFSFNVIGTASNGLIRYGGASSASIKISVLIDVYAVVPFGASVKFQIMRKRSNTNSILFESETIQQWGGRYTYTLEAKTTAQPGDDFFIQLVAYLRESRTPPSPVTINSNGLISRVTIDQDPPGWVQYGYGDAIEVNKTIPKNVYQRDFFISVVKMFNLMITEDTMRDKHLKLTPYIDFFNPDPATYIEWSYKVARDRPWVIKPMSEANARLYDFKYKEDNDYFNETYKKKWNEIYGNKTFDNRLEFSKDRANVELIFSPSVLVGYQDEDKIFPAIYKFDTNANKKTPQGHNIRIMQLRYYSEITEWAMYNDDTPLTGALTDYLYCGHFDNPEEPLIDINWGVTRELFYNLPTTGNLENNLFFLFYSPYMAEIIDRDSRLLTCEIFLNEGDITNLDFSRFVMVDGALFRLQKIIDWTVGELCKTELLRVINTTYPLPAPVSAGLFRLRWKDITEADTWIAGDRASVDDWNTFFGSNFSSVFVEGDTVTLVGYTIFFIAEDLFRSCTELTHIYDDSGCVSYIENGAFLGCGELIEARFSKIEKIYDNVFEGCEKLIKFTAPTVRTIGSRCFADCIKIKEIDLTSLGIEVTSDDFCGADLNNNEVFRNIYGQSIKLLIDFAAYDRHDADIDDLITNNIVQLILR
jgi:hypothetical protein